MNDAPELHFSMENFSARCNKGRNSCASGREFCNCTLWLSDFTSGEYTPYHEELKSLERNQGSKSSKIPTTKKRYLGVQVKMPVRDMLKKIRTAKGLDPTDPQVQRNLGRTLKFAGEKKRVSPRGARKNRKSRVLSASLEDLAIITEVLEEDLKASKPHRHPSVASPNLYSSNVGGQQGGCWEPSSSWDAPGHSLYISPSSTTQTCSINPSVSPSDLGGCCYGDKAEMSISSIGVPLMACSPFSPGCQEPSPWDSVFQRSLDEEGEAWGNTSAGWPSEVEVEREMDWSSQPFFQAQLEWEDCLLRGLPDTELLLQDSRGRMLLHNVVNEGKRALAYVTAKRMAALNMLNVKDAEGKTALHLAAEKNQHLIVADLVYFGVNVNERDGLGKTSLHLAAEKGYVRVLEVLRNSGLCVEVDAADLNGFSALQRASTALEVTARELERSADPRRIRILTLQKEQLADAVAYLLQMGGRSHAPNCGSTAKIACNTSPLAYHHRPRAEQTSECGLFEGEPCGVVAV